MEIVNYTEEVTEKKIFFPSINKNNTLRDYKEVGEEYGGTYQNVLIKKLLICSFYEFNRLANTFIEDNPIYEKIGGTCMLDSDPKIKEVEDMDFNQFCNWTKKNASYWKANRHVEVVKVQLKDDENTCFFVNTEGYEYARYVGYYNYSMY